MRPGPSRALAMKTTLLADPQISPDGKSIICAVSRQSFEEDRGDFNNSNEIFVTSAAGGDGIDLTRDIEPVFAGRRTRRHPGVPVVAAAQGQSAQTVAGRGKSRLAVLDRCGRRTKR